MILPFFFEVWHETDYTQFPPYGGYHELYLVFALNQAEAEQELKKNPTVNKEITVLGCKYRAITPEQISECIEHVGYNFTIPVTCVGYTG